LSGIFNATYNLNTLFAIAEILNASIIIKETGEGVKAVNSKNFIKREI